MAYYKTYEGPVSGLNYDRYVDRYDDSTLSRMQRHYWTAKQAIRSKFGRKEDNHLMASDAELDAKLSVFFSVRDTCESMLRCIERYQDYICELSLDENSIGRFLKQNGKQDKTQAGKMMSAVGRAQGYAAQQRLALRVPLVRLYQELDVFTERAVRDCLETVEAVERARTAYRGSLLWMKNVSEQLDPETYRQLDKFRNIQSAVRRSKSRFDKLKLDCLQKIDLLAASRCNLFSNLMTNYQNCLLHFWEQTAKAHQTVSENFKGYQHYEFVVLKDLAEPSKRLAELTAGVQSQSEVGDESKDAELIALGDEMEQMLFGADSPEHKSPVSFPDRLLSNSPLGIEIEMDTTNEREDTQQDGVVHSLPVLHSDAISVPKLAPPPGWSCVQLGDFIQDDPISHLLQNDNLMNNDDISSFAYQWDHAFGTSKKNNELPIGDGVADSSSHCAPMLVSDSSPYNSQAGPCSFLPSELLDLSVDRQSNKKGRMETPDKNTWLDLFADLDPLKNYSVQTDSTANRQC